MALAVLTAIAVSVERIRRKGANCSKCRYDLAGLSEHALCPECGARPELRAFEVVSYRLHWNRLIGSLCAAAMPLIALPLIVATLGIAYTEIGPWDANVASVQIGQDLGSRALDDLILAFAWHGLLLASLARWLSPQRVATLAGSGLAGGLIPVMASIVQAGGREPIWSVSDHPLWVTALIGTQIGVVAAAAGMLVILRQPRKQTRSLPVSTGSPQRHD